VCIDVSAAVIGVDGRALRALFVTATAIPAASTIRLFAKITPPAGQGQIELTRVPVAAWP